MSDKEKSIQAKKCMTPEFQVSFPQVFKAKAFDEDQAAKYSITMLFPKNVDISALKKAAFNAAVEKWGPKESWPKGLRLPFSDGDDKADLEGYKGHIFVRASSKQKPGVVNQKREPITEEDGTFYAGCYARATLIAFAYGGKGTKFKPGVSFSLQNVQKLRDGKPFSGRKAAHEEFDEVEDTSSDASSYDGGGGDDDDSWLND